MVLLSGGLSEGQGLSNYVQSSPPARPYTFPTSNSHMITVMQYILIPSICHQMSLVLCKCFHYVYRTALNHSNDWHEACHKCLIWEIKTISVSWNPDVWTINGSGHVTLLESRFCDIHFYTEPLFKTATIKKTIYIISIKPQRWISAQRFINIHLYGMVCTENKLNI